MGWGRRVHLTVGLRAKFSGYDSFGSSIRLHPRTTPRPKRRLTPARPRFLQGKPSRRLNGRARSAAAAAAAASQLHERQPEKQPRSVAAVPESLTSPHHKPG